MLTGDLKNTIKNLLNVKKAKDLLKLAGGGVSAGVSSFAAWLNSEEITPNSWTGWFVANTLSVKARAGLGINFGGSVFAGTYADWGWEPLNFDFEKARKSKVWYGGTIDIGVAGGTPAVEVGLHYASKYWLMDEDRVHSWKKDGLAFGIRWYQFIKLKPDSIQFYEKVLGIKFPQWLKDVINISTSFAIKNDIKSVDDYDMLANKEILDNEYKIALASKGYNTEFFASINDNNNNDLA
ncbi:hypothetical protein [Chryseobacterium polytrichastri]|uniref:Uncharacterized protein n=1 Tax=Chryseobacterium polytrichastri TaxID=1302687 RepID=A0A1M6Y530_9FLAO|nr:hypothetical protein [Chryseobacterium polytrichastri]SHL13327.1 hypothetical protein SAMN05444267_101290 [Chryseobacterium polytrichastri]